MSPSDASVAMPALIGTDPMGFLAALGVLRLATVELGWPATVCWPEGPRASAVLGGCPTGKTLDDVVDSLVGIVQETKLAGRLIPGVDGFPPAKESSSGSDPVKDLTLGERTALGSTSHARSTSFAEWLVAVVALAARQELDARDRLTAAFVRPTGQVTFDRSLSGGLDGVTRERLFEALVEWVRVDGVTGNYFDQRAVRDEFVGTHTKGAMKNSGVPGAAWLALMALPYFPVRTPRSGRATTVGFQRTRGKPTRMVWPIWSVPLTSAAAGALLDHPWLTRIDLGPMGESETERRRRNWANAKALRALKVSAVFSSDRRPGPQGPEGALGPSTVLAPVRASPNASSRSVSR